MWWQFRKWPVACGLWAGKKKSLATGHWSLITLLFLASCGFEPMYGDASMQAIHTPLEGNMVIDQVGGATGREAQVLKAALEDRFNPEGIKFARPDYHLTVILHKSLIPEVVKSDGTIERYNIRFDSEFKLIKNGTPQPVFSGSLRTSGSYNVVTTQEFATFEADRDTTERVLKEMAEEYLLRLSGYFGKS